MAGRPRATREYTGFVALVGQYESNVGFRGAAAEFHEEYDSFRERVLANDFQNIALPRTPTAPLVLRDDFVCVYRDLITKIRPNAVFCDKTFEDPTVVNSCSGTRSVPQPPRMTPSGTGGSSGTAGSSGSGRHAAAPAAPAARRQHRRPGRQQRRQHRRPGRQQLHRHRRLGRQQQL